MSRTGATAMATVMAIAVAAVEPVAGAEPGPGSGTNTGSGSGSGSGAKARKTRHDGAWLMLGGAVGCIVVGGVLQYSATSSEQDVKDLYLGDNGRTPVYDPTIAAQYHQLIDEGNRYADLAWVAFGAAAGFAAAATIWFVHDAHVTPVVTPKETGVALQARF